MSTVRRDGFDLEYRVDGPDDGPALLLANSLGTDLHLWDPQIAAWAQRYRVVRTDLRGHGGSGAPPQPYTLDDLGADAVAVLDAVGVGRAHVCGISVGGMVAQWLALRHPARVDALVLANTSPRVGTVDGWEQRIDAVRTGGTTAVRDAVIERYFSAAFRARSPEVVDRAARVLADVDDEGYVGCCTALRDADLRDEVGRITAPTLVIGGTEDVSTPPGDVRALHAAIPDSDLVMFDGAAHLSNLEEPERFTAVVADHLANGRQRPTVGGYRSEKPLTAEEIDAELARGFGDDDRR